ncbi:tyrosine recombinase XerC [Collinsella sp. AGMB00827]|uniref:Tyrosine recombinase XerC n=1 Tax=Collinsella ureilytica TaxID=2869515 RepID=A0ABS7MLR2_9ACTN|nr:tyrosine recombinase XerC [Collinsella urealyticum]MBY4798040.1 tyrosine recombinase XerC [Collinsella urealyticum]
MSRNRFVDAVDDFISYLSLARIASPETVRAYSSHIEQFIAWLDLKDLDGLEVPPRELRSYLANLSQAGLAPKSIAAHLSSMRSLYRWLVIEDIIQNDPTAALMAPKLPKTLPHTLTATQMDRFLKTPDTSRPDGLRDACFLEFLYASGARISEAANLTIDSFSPGYKTARLHGKGDKERIVPLHRSARLLMEDYLLEARPELLAKARLPQMHERAVFISTRGRPMTADALRSRFRRLRIEAGVPAGITPHAMRHTFATDLLAGGADLRSVQELLGHASLSTTQLYTHLTPERLQDALIQAHPRAETSQGKHLE